MIWIHALSPWSTRDSRRTSTPTSALFNFRPVDQKHQRGHQILSHLIWFEIMSITNIRIWKLESVFRLYTLFHKQKHTQSSFKLSTTCRKLVCKKTSLITIIPVECFLAPNPMLGLRNWRFSLRKDCKNATQKNSQPQTPNGKLCTMYCQINFHHHV